jgi:alpha-tubulin suppressor-like RCC1 family protein
VWTWGSNAFGNLGGGATVAVRYEPAVAVAAGSGIVQVAAGGYHVVAARTNGTVIGWGSNSYGELGNGATAAQSDTVQVGRLTSVSQIAAGEYHTLAIYTRPLVARP